MGSWELQHPKVLQNDQGILMFDKYETLGDPRKVKIYPCSSLQCIDRSDSADLSGSESYLAAKTK